MAAGKVENNSGSSRIVPASSRLSATQSNGAMLVPGYFSVSFELDRIKSPVGAEICLKCPMRDQISEDQESQPASRYSANTFSSSAVMMSLFSR
jgi:hypothetical protein